MRRSHLSAVLFLMALESSGSAAEFSLPLTDDTYINANNPSANYGTDSRMVVHDYGPKEGLVRFDATAISGTSVVEATLTIRVSGLARPGIANAYAVTGTWDEGTVTWQNQPPSESTPSGSFVLEWAGMLVTANVTDTVQRWADGSLPAAGFAIATDQAIRAYIDTQDSSGVAASLTVITEESGGSVQQPKVLDLSNPEDCVIDEPGHYVLDRNWYNTPPAGAELPVYGCGITVSADATIDLRGFFIDGGQFWPNYQPIINIVGGDVVLRNGRLSGTFVSVQSVSGSALTMERVNATGSVLAGADARIVDSQVSGGSDAALIVGQNSIVRDSRIRSSGAPCLEVTGVETIVRDNEFDCNEWPGVAISASHSVFYANRVRPDGLLVIGDKNIIMENDIDGGIRIDGTGNVIDGNVSPESFIEFLRPGNYYGNNRVGPPGFLGTTDQVDWGGNAAN